MTTTVDPNRTAYDPTAFTWHDTAVGGVRNRNDVRDLSVWTPPAGRTDVYVTWMRFLPDFADHTARNLTADGKPSVAHYDGPAWAPFVPFDIDEEDRVELAHQRARTLLLTLDARYGVDLGAVRCNFSGQKGFSFEIPAILFGGFAPADHCRELAGQIKALAFRLLTDAGIAVEAIDQGVYDATRLWRVPNTRHSKSRRYKVPLTAAEVLRLDLPAILDLARTPRPLTLPDDDEWTPNPALCALWQSITRGQRRSSGARSGPRRPSLPDTLTKGTRHEALRTEALRLRVLGWDADETDAALQFINTNRCDGAKSEQEVRALADWVAALPQEELSDGDGGMSRNGTPLRIRPADGRRRLSQIAGTLRRFGIAREPLTACLLAINSEHAEAPLSEREIRGIVAWAMQLDAGQATGRPFTVEVAV